MASKEKIASCLNELGLEVGEDIIEKFFDLSVSYNVEPQEFAELYVAYSATYCDGAEPTISSLEEFERKELANYRAVESTNTEIQRDYDDFNDDDDDDDVMAAYCNTPSTKTERAQHVHFRTPARDANSSFNGTTDSPISVSGKDVRGKVVVTFGNSNLFKAIDWTNSEKQMIKIERFVDSNGNSNDFNADEDYMYDTLSVKCSLAADRLFDIGQEICVRLMNDRPSDYDNLLNNMTHVGVPNQTTVKCVGRICSDSDSKLDQNSTLLIGADEMQLRTARINFNRLKSYAVFPGQIVFAQGLNPRGDTFFVDQIFSERTLKYAEAPKLSEDLSFVVASGPFTMANELNYETLTELLAYCKQHKPDVLILLGPFLDADNQMVQECSVKIPYATHFETLILNIHEAVGHDMEILIVSSSQDVHSTAVYPTHPFTTENQYKNVTFLPDPCLLSVNGVTIAMTATDIFNHILDAEVALNAGDKIKRITNYLLHQRSFYPLSPPSDRVNVDFGLAQQFATLPIVPNILIMPSSSKCYARGIDNCLVVNPGRLVEGSSSGTFGRIKVTANADTKILNNYVGCQIIRI